MEEEGEETKRLNDRAPPRAPTRAFSAQLIELRLKLDRIGDFGVRGGGSEDSESVVVLLSNNTLIFFQPKMIFFFPKLRGSLNTRRFDRCYSWTPVKEAVWFQV